MGRIGTGLVALGTLEPDVGVQRASLGPGDHPHRAGALLPEHDRPEPGADQRLHREARPRRASAARCGCGPRAARSPPAPDRAGSEGHGRSPTRAGPSSSSTPAMSVRPTLRGDRSGNSGQVRLGDAEGRVRQPVGQLTVVGEQDQPFGVDVEPADVEQPLGPIGDEIAEARPAAVVGHRRQHPARLVDRHDDGAGGGRHALAVDPDDRPSAGRPARPAPARSVRPPRRGRCRSAPRRRDGCRTRPRPAPSAAARPKPRTARPGPPAHPARAAHGRSTRSPISW